MNLLHAEKTDRKFRFVEDFEDYEDGEYLQEQDEEEEPEETETKFFGKKVLRQIARVEWKSVTIVKETAETLPSGKVKYKEEEVVYWQEVQGELGGWLEHEYNLSQKGKCWVEQDSYVMGDARVMDDVKVSGGAEIGESAKVSGEVEIKGPIGIGGSARVSENVKITGGQRLAVYGSAVVVGDTQVLENSRVYGNARVGMNAPKYMSQVLGMSNYQQAILSGNARVYGKARVYGAVADDAEVYGRAKVEGWVSGRAQVGGTANIWKTGQVVGDVRILKGDVNGRLDGEKAYVNYPVFYLAASSVYVAKRQKGESVHDKADYLPDEKKNRLMDRETRKYDGKIRSLRIYKNSRIEDCDFEGTVEIEGCSMKGCKVKDSMMGTGDNVYTNLYASDSTFENCLIPEGEFLRSKLDAVTVVLVKPFFNGIHLSQAHFVQDSTLKECTLLQGNSVISECELKGVSVEAYALEGKKLSDCAVIQSYGGSYTYTIGLMAGLWRWQTNRDPEHHKLIEPKEYGKYLGKSKWGAYQGIKELKGIASYVRKFDGVPDAIFYSRNDYWKKSDNEADAIYKKEMKMQEERRAWFDERVDEIKKRIEESSEGKDPQGYITLKRLLIYLESLDTTSWWILSESSFNRIKDSLERTINSYDGVSFTPMQDYGVLEIDPSIAEYYDKWKIPYYTRHWIE